MKCPEGEPIETDSRLIGLPRAEQYGEMGLTVSGCGVSFCGHENALDYVSADRCRTL